MSPPLLDYLIIIVISASDLISEKDMILIAELTGCSARASPPSCTTTPNLKEFRTPTNVCNNR